MSLVVALGVAGFGLIGNMVVARTNAAAALAQEQQRADAALRVEQQKAEAALILEAAKATSDKVRCANLEVQLFGPDHQPFGPVLHQSSRALPPALSNRGRILLTHAAGEFWHYREVPWPDQSVNPTASAAPAPPLNRILARVRSSCVPTDATLAPDLLFVVGCDPHTIDRWYRVLRPDGTLVLKGTLHSRDLPPLPIPDPSPATFSIALPVSTSGYAAGSPFHAADLSFETVRLLRAQDGQILFTARTQHPAPTRQPAATSADATTLALFDGDNIALYALKP